MRATAKNHQTLYFEPDDERDIFTLGRIFAKTKSSVQMNSTTGKPIEVTHLEIEVEELITLLL